MPPARRARRCLVFFLMAVLLAGFRPVEHLGVAGVIGLAAEEAPEAADADDAAHHADGDAHTVEPASLL
ncbi:MAG: hypothetical protein K6T29_09115, partial [Peptococcaceae bacterium]|nr:hypothetical protein [Peptococcaceae bacterium]